MFRKILAVILLLPSLSVLASPEKDFDKFVSYFKDRFPNTPYEDYKNGVTPSMLPRESNGRLWKNFLHMNLM